jgi:hypothetical protein
MSTNYDLLFQELCAQIRDASAKTADVLNQLRQQCCAQTAYYAAFIFICLEAQRETNPELHRSAEIDAENLRSFSFFEAAKDQPQALGLFNAALECYKRDLSQGSTSLYTDDHLRYG